jgi:hypothetical protein
VIDDATLGEIEKGARSLGDFDGIGAEEALELVAEIRRLWTRADAALQHFSIGHDTWWAGLPVDWAYVASRMAQALAEPTSPEDER